MGNHAVENGVLKHVSASQIKEFAGCERKWYLNKVKHLPQPISKALETGTRLHAQLENYHLLGAVPEHGSLKRLIALPEFPKTAHDHLLVEHPRDYNMKLELSGVPVRGRMDFLDWSNLTRPHVWDLKSSSNFKYALTPEALSRDVQLALYSKWAFSNFSAAREVLVSHAYAHTKVTDACIVTSDPLTPEHVDSVIGGVTGLVARMCISATLKDQDAVPGNSRACGDYGGCPYRGSCTHYLAEHPDYFDLDSDVTLPPSPGVTTMTLKEKLAAKNSSSSASSVAVGVNPPDAAKPAPVVKYVPPPVVPTIDPEVEFSTGSAGRLLCLFINCVPTKGVGAGTQLEEYIARLSAPIVAKHKVTDVRQVKFGEGTAELVAAVLKDPPIGLVFASTFGLSGLVVDALLPLATKVVRGF